jgi:hypothetical protein
MKTTLSAMALIFILLGTPGLAQTTTETVVDDFTPASSNQPGRQYPQVNSEGRARIRIVAPQAQSLRPTDLQAGEKKNAIRDAFGVTLQQSDGNVRDYCPGRIGHGAASGPPIALCECGAQD